MLSSVDAGELKRWTEVNSMIYIVEQKFDRQLDLLDYFISQGEYDIIFWFFPESKLKTIFNLKPSPENLIEGEPATTYDDGFKPRKTKKIKLTSDLLAKVRKSSKLVKINCDSLVLYLPQKNDWIVSTIDHEGICLVNDDSFLSAIISQGFSASLEKPKWW